MKLFLGSGEGISCVCTALTIFFLMLKGVSVKVSANELRLIFWKLLRGLGSGNFCPCLSIYKVGMFFVDVRTGP